MATGSSMRAEFTKLMNSVSSPDEPSPTRAFLSDSTPLMQERQEQQLVPPQFRQTVGSLYSPETTNPYIKSSNWDQPITHHLQQISVPIVGRPSLGQDLVDVRAAVDSTRSAVERLKDDLHYTQTVITKLCTIIMDHRDQIVELQGEVRGLREQREQLLTLQRALPSVRERSHNVKDYDADRVALAAGRQTPRKGSRYYFEEESDGDDKLPTITTPFADSFVNVKVAQESEKEEADAHELSKPAVSTHEDPVEPRKGSKAATAAPATDTATPAANREIVAPAPLYTHSVAVVTAASKEQRELILTGDAAQLNALPLRTSAELYDFYQKLRRLEDKKTGPIPYILWARSMQRCKLQTVDSPPPGYWQNMVIRDTQQRERRNFVNKCLRFLPNLKSLSISDCGDDWPIQLHSPGNESYIFPSLESASVTRTNYTPDIIVAVCRTFMKRNPNFKSLTLTASCAPKGTNLEKLNLSAGGLPRFV